MKTAIIALALLGAAAPALAQPVDPQAVIARADRNGDGSLDLAEFLAAQRNVMALADTDGRPGLSLDEFRASLDPSARPNAQASFTASDANANGALEPDEFAAYHTYVFNTVLDLNHDGRWTVAEFRTLLATIPGATTTSSPPAEPSPEAAIAALDTDQNGSVSAFEYVTFQTARFPQLDTNGNGRLSAGEFRASLDRRGRAQADASLQAFDANRNNQLSLDEFVAFHIYVFTNIFDINHDGSWTVDEYRAFMRGR